MRLAVSGGQPMFTLRLPMFDLSRADFLSLLWSPSTNIKLFYFCQKYRLKDTRKIFKNSCRFKTWMGFVGQILIKLGTSSIWGFLLLSVWYSLCKHAGGHSVTAEACTPTSPHLPGFVCYGGLKAHWSYLAMRIITISYSYHLRCQDSSNC